MLPVIAQVLYLKQPKYLYLTVAMIVTVSECSTPRFLCHVTVFTHSLYRDSVETQTFKKLILPCQCRRA